MKNQRRVASRTPQGVRGLKSICRFRSRIRCSRTPQGVRGLKFRELILDKYKKSRTPQGVRGLKFIHALVQLNWHESHPARGAWIEIFVEKETQMICKVAPRKGCVD